MGVTEKVRGRRKKKRGFGQKPSFWRNHKELLVIAIAIILAIVGSRFLAGKFSSFGGGSGAETDAAAMMAPNN
ncbi:MAG TPA: hypothetical protein P5287_08075 [bacterium]|nr:hypothetical protein [bacterium]